MDREQVGMNKVFGVKAERKIHLILSEDVLEEMIRNSITEFDWEEVQIIGR